MEKQEQGAAGGVRRVPRRYWWLKRLVALGVVFWGGAYWFLGYAGRTVERRLDADLARLRAAGEPALAWEFGVTTLPDEENGTVNLSKAHALLIERVPDAAGILDGNTPATPAEMSDLLAKAGPALEEVRRARGKRGEWKIKIEHPAFMTLLPQLNEQRTLIRLLQGAAADAQRRGDATAAAGYLRDMVTMSDLNVRQPFLVGTLVGTGQIAQTATAIQNVLPKLDLGPAGGAAEKEVKALLEQLTDERMHREGIAWGVQGERAGVVDTVRMMATGNPEYATIIGIAGGTGPAGPPTLRGFAPAVLGEARSMLAWETQFVEAARQPTLAEAQKRFPPPPNSGGVYRPLQNVLLPSFGPAFTRFYGGLQQRRSTAVMVAGVLYERKHGRAPAKIEELVGEFLPARPVDAGTGEAMALFPGPTTRAAKEERK